MIKYSFTILNQSTVSPLLAIENEEILYWNIEYIESESSLGTLIVAKY